MFLELEAGLRQVISSDGERKEDRRGSENIVQDVHVRAGKERGESLHTTASA